MNLKIKISGTERELKKSKTEVNNFIRKIKYQNKGEDFNYELIEHNIETDKEKIIKNKKSCLSV